MTRLTKTVSVDRNKFINFKKIADGFYLAALNEIKEARWNAAGVLIIHAAISYADSITVKFGGVRSRGDNHQDVVRLLDSLLSNSEDKSKALNQLERLIAHKTSVSYSGDFYDKKDIKNYSNI
jgi:hypothetical protein